MPMVGKKAPFARRVVAFWAVAGLVAMTGCSAPDPFAERDELAEIPDAPPAEETTWMSTNSAPSESVPVVEPERFVDPGERIHVVQKGDTLFALARTYYADQSKWKLIFESNRDLIRDPHSLFPGQELRIH